MSAIHLHLPFPPSVNTYWRYGRLANGRSMHMISKKGREYTASVSYIVLESSLTYSFFKDELLDICIKLYPPDRRRRDIDNYTKGIFDALSKCAFWVDDNQVKKMQIEMMPPTKPGRVELVVNILTEPVFTLI